MMAAVAAAIAMPRSRVMPNGDCARCGGGEIETGGTLGTGIGGGSDVCGAGTA